MKEKLGINSELEAGSGGVFDVWADGDLVFSKDEAGDFPEPAEILRRLNAKRG